MHDWELYTLRSKAASSGSAASLALLGSQGVCRSGFAALLLVTLGWLWALYMQQKSKKPLLLVTRGRTHGMCCSMKLLTVETLG